MGRKHDDKIASKRRSLILLTAPDRELTSGRIDELEPSAAGEFENGSRDDPARFRDGGKCGFDIIDVDDGQRYGQGLRGIALEPDIGRMIGRCAVGWTVICKRPSKGFGIECAREFVSCRAWKLEIVEASRAHGQ